MPDSAKWLYSTHFCLFDDAKLVFTQAMILTCPLQRSQVSISIGCGPIEHPA